MSTWDQVKEVYGRIPALWRDIGVALLVILIVMGGLWTYTGQPVNQAPLVVVESGSMMHDDPPYGRLGTIDPGDLILVKAVDPDPWSVVTKYGGRSATDSAHPGEGDRSGYGEPGDVVIYRQDFCPGQRTTPIIHRAITWVEVERSGGQKVFSYHDASGRWQSRQPDVHLPEVRLQHERAFDRSGWITKGDNPNTNQPADQTQICAGTLIEPEWLVGKARGEIPWIGLLKFIFQGNNWDVSGVAGVCSVGKANAPCDAFTMLWISLGILILVPLLWDVVLRMRRSDDGEDPPSTRTHAAMPPPEVPPHRPGVPPRRPVRRQGEGALPARPRPRWAERTGQDAPEDDEDDAR